MPKFYSFDDVLDEKGNVDKSKIDCCAFSKLAQGDYIGVRFYFDSEDGAEYLGSLFAKVISVTIPRACGLFLGQNPGQVKVELPDGTVTDLLKFNTKVSSYSRHWGNMSYQPTQVIYNYFYKKCAAEGNNLSDRVYFDIYNYDHENLLQSMRTELLRRVRKHGKETAFSEESVAAMELNWLFAKL